MLTRRVAVCLPLPLVVLIVLSGCAGRSSGPERERVTLKTTSATRYYAIRGTTTTAIFDEIDHNGLLDTKSRRAVGLTSADWNMDWKGLESDRGVCRPESMTITLTLVVTLPQHARSNDLPRDINSNWRRFAASVAAHEQHHVDIYLAGARRIKSRMESVLTKTTSCAELGKTIRTVWIGEQADIEKAQDQFHVEDDAKSRDDRKPLQAQIDSNQARLSVIDAEIKGLDQTLAAIKRRHAATQTELGAIKAEMAKSGAAPPSCSQSGVARRFQALCQQYSGLVTAYNALVEQHNGVVSRREILTEEHNRIVATTNTLIEVLNWTR